MLLTQRPAAMAFAGDMFVFPGGRVDEADADAGLAGDVPAADAPFAVAAIRELFEEAGVLLAERRDGRRAGRRGGRRGAGGRCWTARRRSSAIAEALGLRFRTDLLVPIAHWTTPPIMPRRFDTRFFAAELPAGVEPAFDDGGGRQPPLADRPGRARRHGRGRGRDVAPDGSDAPAAGLRPRPRRTSGRGSCPGDAPAPRVVGERPGLTRVVVGSAGAVPGQTVNATSSGRRELILVDPGDPSDAAADAILGAATAAGGRIVAIALTHADPDHAAGAEALALRLELPILAGPGAQHELPYLVRELADGERIGAGGGGAGGRRDAGPAPGPRRVRPRRGQAARSCSPATSSAAGRPGDPRTAGRSRLGGVAGARPARCGPARLYPGHGEPIEATQ